MLSVNQVENLRLYLNKFCKARIKKDEEKQKQIQDRIKNLYNVDTISQAVKLYRSEREKIV